MVTTTIASKQASENKELYQRGQFLPAADVIAEVAYRYWIERGCPDGSPDEDWLKAERQIKHDRTPGAVA